MAILCLFRVWLIIDHLSIYDILLVGAAKPFMFSVAILMFTLILLSLYSPGIGLCHIVLCSRGAQRGAHV